jgi:hypothetical protein
MLQRVVVVNTFFLTCLLAVAIPVNTGALAGQDAAGTPDRLTFENDVVPILQSRCFKCHGETKREAGLDLRRRFTLMSGGDSGSAISPGRPQQSLLLELIDDELMPPENEPQLNEKQICRRRHGRPCY